MHSFVPDRWIIPLCLVALLALAGCNNDGSRSLPDPVSDTSAPYIVRVSPAAEQAGYEIDFQPQILFSEEIDIASLLDSGVQLFSGPVGFDQNTDEHEGLYEREINIEHSTVPGEEKLEDEASGRPIDTEATEIKLSLKDGRLALNNVYTLTVSPSVHDLVQDDLETAEDERNYLEEDLSSVFITEPGYWHGASELSFKYLGKDGVEVLEHSASSHEPNFKSLEGGATLMVWKQVIDGYTQIWASQYLVDQGVWVVPGATSMAKSCQRDPGLMALECVNSVRLDRNDTSSAHTPVLALNEEGQAVVLWSQARLESSDTTIWINMFDGGSWSGASELVPEVIMHESTASYPKVSLSESGKVVSAWIEIQSGISRVRSTIFDFASAFSGASFGSPIYIDAYSGDLGGAGQFDLKFNALEQGMVIWTQVLDGIERIRSRRIDLKVDGGWKAIHSIDLMASNGKVDVISPVISVALNGDVSAAWRQSNGTVYDLVYSRNVGGIWSAPEKLESDDSSVVKSVNLTYDNLNNLFVVWSVVTESNLESLSLRTFHHNSGWATPLEFLSLTSSEIGNVSLVFDYEGNGNLQWSLSTQDSAVVYSSTYSKLSKVWLGEELLLNSSADTRNSPINLQALRRDGRMLSVWASVSGSESGLKSSIFKEKIEDID